MRSPRFSTPGWLAACRTGSSASMLEVARTSPVRWIRYVCGSISGRTGDMETIVAKSLRRTRRGDIHRRQRWRGHSAVPRARTDHGAAGQRERISCRGSRGGTGLSHRRAPRSSRSSWAELSRVTRDFDEAAPGLAARRSPSRLLRHRFVRLCQVVGDSRHSRGPRRRSARSLFPSQPPVTEGSARRKALHPPRDERRRCSADRP